MRAGGCAAQQTLSAEAASVLKHSLTLARRRGHAQVTPLHVAATLLSSRASVLRRACLKSQPHLHPSHPLQCRALELCFNVALNRLPAAPGPLLHAQPSLSNALIAALKRAQAHQRRGCIEQHQHQHQQPPIIPIKVELDQLILSILDDPSVSRVMREAGFSSTSVKNNLEDSNLVSSVFQCYNTSGGGIYSTPNSPPANDSALLFHPHHFLSSYAKKPATTINNINEDIKVLLQVLSGKKRRNAVIISDSLPTSESLISELMRKVEYGLDVPDELKSSQLVKFQFSSVPLMFMKKEEVEMNVGDLKRKVESRGSVSSRVIIYIGDLKWAVEGGEFCSSNDYNPIDHLIVEIGKLLAFYNNSSSTMRVWLIATANYQTYIKCQMKQPPLDLQWALQAVSLPSGGLGLSLNATSGRDNSRITYSENSSPVAEKKVFCLDDELADGLTCCQECISNYDKEAASPQLPYWLNSHSHAPLQKEDLNELRRKYNKLCQRLHQNPVPNSSWNHLSYPTYKKSVFSDSETISFLHPAPSSLPRFRRQQSCHIDFTFTNSNTNSDSNNTPNLDSLKDKEDKITLALGNATYADSNKSAFDHQTDLYRAFKENVPWQTATFPLLIEALRGEDKIILMQGNDGVGKRRMALSIAESLFGSSDSLFCMNMKREGTGRENVEKLETALKNREGVVALVEHVDFADPLFLTFVLDGVKSRGRRRNDVFLLTMGDDGTTGEANGVIQMRLIVGGDHKRKAEEMEMEEEVSSNSIMNQIRELKKKINSSVLDLNIKAGDEDDDEKGFVSRIKNRVVLDRGSGQEREAKGVFLTKLRRAFRESSSGGNFNVDETVLTEVFGGAGWYLNGLFEEWLKDVFQTSLNGVNSGGKVSFRLCLGGNIGGEKEGFKGTCLPKRIPVSFLG